MAKDKRPQQGSSDEVRVLVRNRRATHDYEIHETLEAGIVLLGSEVKSLRESNAALGDGYIDIYDGEAWLINAKINEYPWANQFNHEPTRKRKLLLHKREIVRLQAKVEQRGMTVIPLQVYLKNGKIKLEIGVATGKRMFEKREAAAAADARREIDRYMKTRRRG